MLCVQWLSRFVMFMVLGELGGGCYFRGIMGRLGCAGAWLVSCKKIKVTLWFVVIVCSESFSCRFAGAVYKCRTLDFLYRNSPKSY
jgi:hypothetical protein